MLMVIALIALIARLLVVALLLVVAELAIAAAPSALTSTSSAMSELITRPVTTAPSACTVVAGSFLMRRASVRRRFGGVHGLHGFRGWRFARRRRWGARFDRRARLAHRCGIRFAGIVAVRIVFRF
jgi:hypothetical protein